MGKEMIKTKMDVNKIGTKIVSLGWIDQLVRASSRYAKVVGSIPRYVR